MVSKKSLSPDRQDRNPMQYLPNFIYMISSPMKIFNGLSKDQKNLLTKWDQLSEKEKDAIYSIINLLLTSK